MRVGYSKGFARLMLGLGILLVGLHGFLLAKGGSGILQIIPGVACLLVGIAYTIRPYFHVEAQAVIFPAAIGPVKKPYPYAAGELRIENNMLFIGEKKTGGRRWLANKTDWDALARRLESADAFD